MRVIFQYNPGFEIKVERVNLCGTFNNWDTCRDPMEYNPHTHRWEKTIELGPGEHRYKFLVNGVDWLYDPEARWFIQNQVGSIDSILHLDPGDRDHGSFSPVRPKFSDEITIHSRSRGSLVWSTNGWIPYPKGYLRESIHEIPNVFPLKSCRSKDGFSCTLEPLEGWKIPEVVVFCMVFEDGTVDDNQGRQYWIPLDLELGGRTYDLSFPSDALGGVHPFRVYLPEGYFYSEKKFPVMLLLHGYGGTYRSDWSQSPVIKKMADLFGIILAWPEGNINVDGESIPSWYINSSLHKTARMEDYVIRELLPYMEHKFRVVPGKGGRGIGGISMGGFGAFYLGAKYHKHFRVACSMSAVYTLDSYRQLPALKKLMGNSWGNRVTDVGKLAKKAEGTDFWFIVGDEEKSALNDNFRLKRLFTEYYRENYFAVLPGDHSNNFWRVHKQDMMEFAARRLCPDFEQVKSKFVENS